MTQEELFNEESEDIDLWCLKEPKRKQHNSGYGYIEIKNPHYAEKIYTEGNLSYYDEREYILRKPTIEERREIVINTIIKCNGRRFCVSELAYYLAVSDRTVQKILRGLEKDGLIEIIPNFGKDGKQKSNSYRYIGKPCKFYGSGLTLKMLYSVDEKYGFRFWDWQNYAFTKDGIWHRNYTLLKNKACSRMERRRYLERKGLPLIIPKDIKYFSLHYSYWIRDAEREMELGSDLYEPLTQDGVIKIPLCAENKITVKAFGGMRLMLYISGDETNPKIKIYNLTEGEKSGTFSWFGYNAISIKRRISPIQSETVDIFGDFTAR